MHPATSRVIPTESGTKTTEKGNLPIRLIATSLLLMLAAACTSPVTNATTTTTTLPLAVPSGAVADTTDELAIIDLWLRQTTAWTAGFDAGIEFWVQHNYPPMNCTFSDYVSSRFPQGPVEGLIIERIAEPGSITLDEGWTIPGGSLEGQVAEGRVYSVSVDTRRYEAGQPTPEPEKLDLHVTILDGEPYFFLGCS